MVVAYLKTTDWHTYTYVNKLSAHDSDFQWLDNINLFTMLYRVLSKTEWMNVRKF